MTSAPNDPARETPEDAVRKAKERLLVFIVVFLGLLIVAGIVAVVLRIIYLSSAGPAQPAASEAIHGAAPGAAERLALPPGASVKSVSVSGDRLAVHYEGPSGTGIAVLDLAGGTVLRRFEIAPEGPRP